MEDVTQFLVLILLLFIMCTIPAESCTPDSCDSGQGPIVRFPFRLQTRQPGRCGYPGFDLHCNTKNQTILTLPRSGDFIVDLIDYKRQVLFIHDPDSCLPNRSLNFSLSGSPFRPAYITKFVLLNCSGGWMDYVSSDYYVPLICLSQRNSTVLASSPAVKVPPLCRRIAEVLVPPWWRLSQTESKEAFELGWSEPRCAKCENRGGICEYKNAGQIGCSKSAGLSRSAKYGIALGVGLSGVLCMIGMACYSCGVIKSSVRHLDPPNSDFDQLPVIRAVHGLDLPTINSYPKTVLGQSLRLPSLSDTTCPICLCDYQSQETLKNLPKCNHYFHDVCIDEWLKLNATCPVCRKSPGPSSMTCIS